MRQWLFICVLIALLAPGTVSAADRKLGTFKDWSAMAFGSGEDVTCMAFSQPTKSAGDYTKRGDIFVFLTHRPAQRTRSRVSIETGYPFQSKAPAHIDIDGETFALRTDGSTAWLDDLKRSPALVEAMKSGRVMVVKGTSVKGTQTRDEYSLLGFTAAARAIDGACQVK